MKKSFILFLILLSTGVQELQAQEFTSQPLTVDFLLESEGSQEEAQPYLEALSEVLNQKTGLIFQMTYLPDIQSGQARLQKTPAHLTLMSLHLFLEKGYRTEQALLSLVSPQNKKDQTSYVLLSHLQNKWPEDIESQILIYSQQSFSSSFFQKILFPQISKPSKLKIEKKESLFATLKKIASKEENHWILLEKHLFENLKKSSMTFVNHLKKEMESKPIPVALVVETKPISEEKKKKALNSLLKLHTDSNVKELLETLRIGRFITPNQKNLQSLVDTWSQTP